MKQYTSLYFVGAGGIGMSALVTTKYKKKSTLPKGLCWLLIC